MAMASMAMFWDPCDAIPATQKERGTLVATESYGHLSVLVVVFLILLLVKSIFRAESNPFKVKTPWLHC